MLLGSGWFWLLAAAFLYWLSRLRVVRAWWYGPPKKVRPPENIRLVYPDGRAVPVECVYKGFYNDLHRWVVVVPEAVWFEPDMHVECDVLPARTEITIPMRGDGAGGGMY